MQKWVSFCILGIHTCLSMAGLHSFSMPEYMQIVQTNFPVGTPFWPMLFHFHGNPPLLSVVHFLATSIFPFQPALFFDISLPLLHVLAYSWFCRGLKSHQIVVSDWIPAILFLNPLLFLYFRYPFYSTFILVLCTALVLVLAKARSSNKSMVLLVILLAVGALFRTTWLPWFGLLIPFFIWNNHGWKTATVVFFIILVPLAWQTKNYLLVGKFTSSTWIGINLARAHMPWQVHNDWIGFIPPFSKPGRYFEILTDDSLIQNNKKETNPYLNANNLNHSVIPHISDRYLRAIRSDFSWTWSLNSWLNGVLILFKSPAIEPHVLQHLSQEGYPDFGLNYDIWHPFGKGDEQPWRQFFVSESWDPGWIRLHAVKNLSIYTLVYPFLLIWMGFRFRKLSKEVRIIYALTLFFTLVYSAADIFESNRMRMEYEPFFYFLVCLFISQQRKNEP